MGGRIGRILSFLRVNKKDAKASDVKINQSGGNTVTCEHFEDAGSDSFPLNSDYPIIMNIDRSGGSVVVGYLDPISEKKAQTGEKRIYARDSGGQVKCEVWLKNDGTILCDNDFGSWNLDLEGTSIFQNANATVTININGTISLINQNASFIISPSGSIQMINQNASFNVGTNGEFNINGARITQNGDIITSDGISLRNHYHAQGNDSNNDSEVPTDTPTATE